MLPSERSVRRLPVGDELVGFCAGVGHPVLVMQAGQALGLDKAGEHARKVKWT